MEKSTTPKRPTRDEVELEEMGDQLVEAKDDGDERALTVWGMPQKVRGRITVLDSRTRLVHAEIGRNNEGNSFLRYYEISYI